MDSSTSGSATLAMCCCSPMHKVWRWISSVTTAGRASCGDPDSTWGRLEQGAPVPARWGPALPIICRCCRRPIASMRRIIGLTCNGAPLLDPTRDFLGVLDDLPLLTSPSPRESQHLALQQTMMYAKMIEDANFMHFFREASVLRLGAAWPMVDLSGELMLAFDADGRGGGRCQQRRTAYLAGRGRRRPGIGTRGAPLGWHLP